jgi:hypothetical protein
MSVRVALRPVGIEISWTGSSFLVGIAYVWSCYASHVGGARATVAKNVVLRPAVAVNVSGNNDMRKLKRAKEAKK